MGTSIRLPKLDQDMVEGQVLEWLVEDGADVAKGEPVVVIETDKVATELIAEASGVIRIMVPEGSSAAVGAELAMIGSSGEIGQRASSTSQTREPDAAPRLGSAGDSKTQLAAAPSQRLPLDRSTWVRPHEFPPRRRASGWASESIPQTPADKPHRAPSDQPASPASLTHRLLVETVTRSWSVPQFATRAVVPATGIRRIVAAFQAREPGSVSVTHVLIKLMAAVCREAPFLNAHYIEDRRVGLDSIDINVLVSAGDDLFNPCVSRVVEKSLRQVAEETRGVVERAIARSLTREDLRPGSMTLSNLGMFDIDDFTPLLFPPQVGILGVGRIADSGDFVATLVVDHRAVNGVQAARWLARFKSLCTDPMQLL